MARDPRTTRPELRQVGSRLKRSLKAEIDEAAWAALNATVSRPFPAPKSGRVAVKVINHYGDEVMKVFGAAS
jgi:adenine-specific DNA-methyltransferase